MWITDLQVAMSELFEIYGMYCCVLNISHNVITMTNGEMWHISGDGHLTEIVRGGK